MLSKVDINGIYEEVCRLVVENRLKEALENFSKLLAETRDADFMFQYEGIDQTYRMMLEYTFRGVPDPKRETVYEKLKVDILELIDLVRQRVLSFTGLHIYTLKTQLEKERDLAKEEAANSLSSHTFESELSRLLDGAEVTKANGATLPSIPGITPKLFQAIWLTDKYKESDLLLHQAIRKSEEMPWYDKSLSVSSLTFSLLNCFDKEKFHILIDYYLDREHEVWQRALTGLVIAVYIYNERILLYPSVNERITKLGNSEEFSNDLKQLLIQVFKAKETEKVTRKFQDEIMPDVKKFESKIREKLDIDSLIENDLFEEKNPDWEKIFEDSPDLLDKIQEMSQMQMEGIDLFMGTFATMKHFDFFREISNWLMPFHKEDQTVIASIKGDQTKIHNFMESMEESFYMCNSDKYSFCFNIGMLPEEQRNRIIGLFNMEAMSMKEISADDELLHKPSRDIHVFTQYIQDIYRFFKLHPSRHDFTDIFDLPWSIPGSYLFDLVAVSPETVNSLGEFLFEKEHYSEAMQYFTWLKNQENAESPVIEKLAYCYQMIGDYEHAVEYYRQAELFDSNRLWNIKKIIYCFRKLGKIEDALKWCQEALGLAPDDVYLHTLAGNCYLDLKDYDKALDHYFKVEFMAPDNKKVMRPIAWCCFASRKLDIAQSYMKSILDNEPKAQDFINAGHVEYCLHNFPKAMEYYRKSLDFKYFSIFSLFESFTYDKEYLLKNGVDKNEITLLMDYLRYK